MSTLQPTTTARDDAQKRDEGTTITLTHTHSDLSIQEEDTDDEDYPEGGLRAHLTCFGCFIGLTAVFGLYTTTGAIQAYVSVNQLKDVETSTVSWIFSLFMFFGFASSIFSGAIFDHSGSFGVLTVGTVLMTAGLMATANCTKVWQFVVAFGLVTGVSTGISMSPLASMSAHYFKQRRATFMGLAALGAPVGGVAFPMILDALFPKIGYAWTIRVMAFVMLVMMIIAILLAKERIRKPKPVVTDYKSFIHTYITSSLDYKAFKDINFICVLLSITMAEVSLMTTVIYFPTYATMRGYDSSTAYILVVTLNAAGVGGFVPGIISDKWLGIVNTSIIVNFICAFSMWVIWLPFGEGLGALYAFAVVYGLFSGSVYCLTPVLVGVVSKTEDYGKRYSTIYFTAAFFLLFMIPSAAAIVGDGGEKQYNNFIVFCSITAIADVLCLVVLRVRMRRLRWCKF